MLMKTKHSWNSVEKAEFLIRIGTLTERGYTISEAIQFFLKYENEKFKSTLKSMLEKLEKGSSVSEALIMLQIPKNIISFVYFAEFYGDLSRGLIDGGNLLKKTLESKTKFQKLIRYPIFLFWILGLFLVIMYLYLFPHFTHLFATLNIQLPLITRLFLLFIENSPKLAIVLLATFLWLYLYYVFIFRKKTILEQATVYTKIPIIGNYYRAMVTYFFAINLSCLMKSGLAIYDALGIFKNVEGLGYISKEADKMITHLQAGEKLQHVLLYTTLYTKALAYIVEHGQANGRLTEELEHYSQWLLNDLEAKMKNLFMIIQPILFLVIGIFILLMFVSILLPVFSLIKGI
jgi:competence protein ComGB